MSRLALDERKPAYSRIRPETMRRRLPRGQTARIHVVIVMPMELRRQIEATAATARDRPLGQHRVREEVAERTPRERGLEMIPPFNHPHVIAGQGTAAKDWIEDRAARFFFLCR